MSTLVAALLGVLFGGLVSGLVLVFLWRRVRQVMDPEHAFDFEGPVRDLEIPSTESRSTA